MSPARDGFSDPVVPSIAYPLLYFTPCCSSCLVCLAQPRTQAYIEDASFPLAGAALDAD